MIRRARTLLPAVALLAAAAVPTATAVTPNLGGHHGCRSSFDRAVHTYVDSTHKRDAKRFASVLHPDVTAIFADGEVMYGKQRTMAFIEPFFKSTGWTQTFKELTREVQGCRSGFVLFDSVFTPAPGADPIYFVIGVTFTYEDGRWLAVHNQDGDGPSYTSTPTAATK